MTSDNIANLYPDLVKHGGRANAIRAAFFEIGSSPSASELNKEIHFVAYTRVELGPRFSQIYIAAETRLFLFDFWNHGVYLTNGETPEILEMIRAIDKWISSDCTSAELASVFRCVKVMPDASAYERGEIVELRWQQYLASLSGHQAELNAFVIAAAAEPKLRQLFPYTSHNVFCFSRCTGYPFTRDTPHVVPLGRDQYEVISSSGTSLGRGGPEVAVALAISDLPPDCKAAVPGSAEELGGG